MIQTCRTCGLYGDSLLAHAWCYEHLEYRQADDTCPEWTGPCRRNPETGEEWGDLELPPLKEKK